MNAFSASGPVFYTFLETIRVIILLNSRYYFPIADLE